MELGEGQFPHSCGNNLEPTMCPGCQSCHIKHIFIQVPSQLVVVSPRKTPILQHLCTHFRIYIPKPLLLGSIQESTPFRPSTSLSWVWFLRAPCCFQITASAAAFLWKASSSPPRNYSQHCHGKWHLVFTRLLTALELAWDCSPSSSKMTQGGFGRRMNSKIRPESNAALQEISFHFWAACRLELPSCDLPPPSCKAPLERSLSPRDVFQQYFMSSFTVFFLSHFQTQFPLLCTQIRLIRTPPQGKDLYTDRLPLQRIKQTRLFLFKFY